MAKRTLALVSILSSVCVASFFFLGKSPKDSCSYDKDCQISLEKNGNVRVLTPRVKALLSLLDQEIVAAGKKYKVDPRSIAGAIAAENSLNVTIDDSIQDFLANAGVTNVMGQSFSYGIGQIYPETAIQVEALAAKVEGRPLRSKKQVADALTDPRESIAYAAAIIKDAQDRYADAGIDIRDNMGALTTLYNLGGIETRLERRRQKDLVRPNFFGIFVEANLKDIEDAIGWSPLRGKYDPAFAVENARLNGLNWLAEPQDIYRAPASCESKLLTGVRGISHVSHRYNKYPIAKVRGAFSIHRSTLDCELRRWSLIQGSEGHVGWIKNEILEAVAQRKQDRRQPSSQSFCEQARSQCLDKVQATSRLKVISSGANRLQGLSLQKDRSPDMESHYRWCTERDFGEPILASQVSAVNQSYLAYEADRQFKKRQEDTEQIQKTGLRARQWVQKTRKELSAAGAGLSADRSRSLLNYIAEQIDSVFTTENKLREGVTWHLKTFSDQVFKKLQASFSDQRIDTKEFMAAVKVRLVEDQRDEFFREDLNNAVSSQRIDRKTLVLSLKGLCRDLVDPVPYRLLHDFATTYSSSSLHKDYYQALEKGVVNLCRLSSRFKDQRAAAEAEDRRRIRVSIDDRAPQLLMDPQEYLSVELSDEEIRDLIANNLGERTQLGQVIGTRTGFGGHCNFDEVETLRELKKVSRLPCVSKILVPQQEFFDKFSALGPMQLDKVVFDSLPIDEFTVLTQGCSSPIDRVLPGRK